MADNRRNNPNPDRLDADDVVDIRALNSAISNMNRLVNAFFDNAHGRARGLHDDIRDLGDSATDELDKLNKYINNLNSELGSRGSFASIVTQSLNRGRSNQISSNEERIAELTRAVRMGTSSFDNVKDEISGLVASNNRLNNSMLLSNTIIKSISDLISQYLGRYIKSFVEGSEKYYSAYQQTFNSISARMGMNYSDTRGVYHDMIISMDSNLKSVVNIAEDLVPALDRAAQAGFTGNQAVLKAYSDSVDQKIMPWLESTFQSDWYTNLFANLTEGQLNQLKSSQLMLQTMTNGNRLLQSGVINSLTEQVAPLLTNIDLNTGGAQNLSEQYQAILRQLVDNGMSTQDAYAQVQTMINNDKNLYNALSSGNISDVMYAANRVRGMDSIEAYGEMTDAINRLADSARTEVGVGAVVSTMGYQTAGGWAMNYSQNNIDQQKAEEDAKALHSATTYYDNAVALADEHLTATQKVQNWLENTGTRLFGEIITALPYGDTFYQQVVNGIGQIISVLRMMAVSAIFSNSSGGLLSSVRGLGGRITSGLGNIVSRAGNIVSNAANAGTIASGALIAGGTLEIVDAARTAYKRSHTQGDAANAATAVEAAAGLGAIAAVVAGTGGVGAVLLALGAAAKYAADKLDETSAVVGEVTEEYRTKVDELKEHTRAEREAANGLWERLQVDRDYIVDRIDLLRQQREAERAAQAQYKVDRGDLLSQVASMEASGNNQDQIVEILRAAGASNKAIENYMSGNQSAESVLTSKWYQRLFGKKDLIQNLSTEQWETLREIAGMAKVEGSYASGLPYVYEDSTVRVHKGERILTAAENSEYSGSSVVTSIEQSNDELIRTLREVASEIIIAIRDINNSNNVNTATNTIARPSVNYDGYAIGLMPQVGKV